VIQIVWWWKKWADVTQQVVAYINKNLDKELEVRTPILGCKICPMDADTCNEVSHHSLSRKIWQILTKNHLVKSKTNPLGKLTRTTVEQHFKCVEYSKANILMLKIEKRLICNFYKTYIFFEN
jgi:hypothetical protein